MTVFATWQNAPEQPVLVGDDVHLWRIAAHQDAGAEDVRLLSDEERDRAARIPLDDVRRKFVIFRGALRCVLSRYTPGPAHALIFVTGPHGKRSLAGGEVSFNLSHAGDYALIAVTRRQPVGVDIERVVASRASAAIASRFFSLAEQAALAALPEAEREAAFFRIWSRKEAVVKALGEGLTCALSSFDVSADAGEARLLAFRRAEMRVEDWTLQTIDAAAGYAAALAVIGPCGRVQGYTWPGVPAAGLPPKKPGAGAF